MAAFLMLTVRVLINFVEDCGQVDNCNPREHVRMECWKQLFCFFSIFSQFMICLTPVFWYVIFQWKFYIHGTRQRWAGMNTEINISSPTRDDFSIFIPIPRHPPILISKFGKIKWKRDRDPGMGSSSRDHPYFAHFCREEPRVTLLVKHIYLSR